ncbi:MAG: Site-specific integrase, partial [Gammaproteobacteria bacterium]|nr:Site-specific integrase [Gammaproteobacteria bacterium]
VGLFIDYSRAQETTLAKLFETYVQEECPKHKGCAIETYTLKGFLADSRNELTEALAERERSIAAGEARAPLTCTYPIRSRCHRNRMYVGVGGRRARGPPPTRSVSVAAGS